MKDGIEVTETEELAEEEDEGRCGDDHTLDRDEERGTVAYDILLWQSIIFSLFFANVDK